jgi:hypothetical protein
VGSVLNLSEKTCSRGKRELKRFMSSMNYDVKGGHSHRVIGKGRGGKYSL